MDLLPLVIAAAVVGAAVGACCCCVVAALLWRWRRRPRKEEQEPTTACQVRHPTASPRGSCFIVWHSGCLPLPKPNIHCPVPALSPNCLTVT